MELQTRLPPPAPPSSSTRSSISTTSSLYISQDQDSREDSISPRSDIQKASFLSFLHFSFAIKLIHKINSLKKLPLTEEDLKPVGYGEDAQSLEKLFTNRYYEARAVFPRKRRAVSLMLYRIFKKDFFAQVIWQFLFGASRVLTVCFLYFALNSAKDPAQPKEKVYPLAAGMFLGLLISMYSLHQFNFRSAYAVNKMKIGILGMMFRKVTKISLLSVHRVSLGKIVNIVTADANNLENVHFLISIMVAPFIIAGATGVLCYFWGVSGLVGTGYMVVSWIFLKMSTNLTIKYRMQRSGKADERIRMLNDFLEMMEYIKVSAWELFGSKTLEKKRSEEVQVWKKIFYLEAMCKAIVFSSHFVAIFLIFVTYTAMGNQITAAKIFPTILLMSYLRQICMIHVYSGFSFIAAMVPYFARIISIMDLPEAQPPIEAPLPKNSANTIEFQDFSGYWPNKDLDTQSLAKLPLEPFSFSIQNHNGISTSPSISTINLEIPKGSFTVIFGPQASGKSSILLAFTREMAKTTGELRYIGDYEYMPQKPLFLAGSIRDNITFGRAYNEELFWKVVEACCLDDELRGLPNKEMSQIGERGVNLNGRQKALIALARSAYVKADIYLLDDPFGELDDKLAKRVFKKVVQGFLSGSTVLLVTQEMNYAKYADKIVLIDNGVIKAQGNHEEVMNQQIEDCSREAQGIFEKIKNIEALVPLSKEASKDIFQKEPKKAESVLTEAVETNIPFIDNGVYLEEERLIEGRVTHKTYWRYLISIFNWKNVFPALVLFVGAESVGWQFSVRLAEWADLEYSDSLAYAIIGTMAFGSLMINLLKFLLYYSSAFQGSLHLHNKMLKNVLNIPIKLFVRSSIGRILNRFSTDMAILDGFLMMALLDVLEGFCLFMVFLIALWAKEPWILLPAGIGLIVYIVIFLWCKKAVNQTRGLELITRSPLYSFFVETATGLVTIRARNQSEDAIKAFYKRADKHSKANIAYRASIRIMSFVLDYVTQIIVIAAFSFLMFEEEQVLASGSFVNMLVQLPSTMQWLLINFVNLHTLMASAARVLHYCQKHGETDFIASDEIKVNTSEGVREEEMELKDSCISNMDIDQSVLRVMSNLIRTGEKVAVIADTRMNLSSLAYSISIEQQDEQESCQIDPVKQSDQNKKESKFKIVRDSMTLIPGDYYLLIGTIRDNLDPKKDYTDEELWEVLDIVGLKDLVKGLTNKMETLLSKGSSVFSESQKQLLCIARSLLKKSSVLIQDKATNKVDMELDREIQKKIIERFKNITVIMATNRVQNVIGYDKVLYLKAGAKEEFDEPYRLLVKEIGDKEITNKEGGFAKLVLGRDAEVVNEVFEGAMMKYYSKRGLNIDLRGRIQSLGGLSEIGVYGEMATAPSLALKEEGGE